MASSSDLTAWRPVWGYEGLYEVSAAGVVAFKRERGVA